MIAVISKMSLHKLMMIALLSLAFSSCGKSKEEKTQPNVTLNGNEGDPAPGGRGTGRTPAPTDGQPVTTPQPKSPPPGQGRTQPVRPPPVKGPVVNPRQPIAQPSQPSQPSQPTLPTEPGANPLENELSFNDADTAKTGGRTDDRSVEKSSRAQYYTGTLGDGLLESLLAHTGLESEAQKSIDSQIARDITDAQLETQKNSLLMKLKLTIKDSAKRARTVTLMSSAENPGTLIPKVIEVIEGDSRVDNALKVHSAQVQCLDLNRQCNVAVVKVNFTNGKAHIIFRKTYAHVQANIYDGSSGDSNIGLQNWKSYSVNRVYQNVTDQKISYVIVTSYEIVGGESEASVLIVTKDRKAIGIKTPMTSEIFGQNANAKAKIDMQLAKKMGIEAESKNDLSLPIQSAHLMKNNGSGQFMIELNFNRKAKTSSEKDARVELIFLRNMMSIFPLSL